MGLNPLESGRVVKQAKLHWTLKRLQSLNPLESGRVVKYFGRIYGGIG